MQSQIEQAQTGLESLALSEQMISQLRENFISIERYVMVVVVIVKIWCVFFCVYCVLNVVLYSISGTVKSAKLWLKIMIR